MRYVPPDDTAFSAALRTRLHEQSAPSQVGVQVGLLGRAAGLALDILPAGGRREQAAAALKLVARVAAGETVAVNDLLDAMQDENDDGALVYSQMAATSEQKYAWLAVASALGFAAWAQCQRTGAPLDPLIQNYAGPDTLDFCVDQFAGIPLDPADLALEAPAPQSAGD